MDLDSNPASGRVILGRSFSPLSLLPHYYLVKDLSDLSGLLWRLDELIYCYLRVAIHTLFIPPSKGRGFLPTGLPASPLLSRIPQMGYILGEKWSGSSGHEYTCLLQGALCEGRRKKILLLCIENILTPKRHL